MLSITVNFLTNIPVREFTGIHYIGSWKNNSTQYYYYASYNGSTGFSRASITSGTNETIYKIDL